MKTTGLGIGIPECHAMISLILKHGFAESSSKTFYCKNFKNFTQQVFNNRHKSNNSRFI